MRVAPVQTSGVANIQFYQPDVDPLAMLTIAAFTALVGLAAAYVPARRAARMDPLDRATPRLKESTWGPASAGPGRLKAAPTSVSLSQGLAVPDRRA